MKKMPVWPENMLLVYGVVMLAIAAMDIFERIGASGKAPEHPSAFGIGVRIIGGVGGLVGSAWLRRRRRSH